MIVLCSLLMVIIFYCRRCKLKCTSTETDDSGCGSSRRRENMHYTSNSTCTCCDKEFQIIYLVYIRAVPSK